MGKFRFSKKPNKAGLIRWRTWTKKAFDEAKLQNKPVFLSLSAVWCHWCHVMDETTFSHIPSISKINEDFIPIRVDTDRRPDIQNRYIMNGWPTNAFLTDEADIITGGTYIPPEEFRTLLDKVSTEWQLHQEKIRQRGIERRKKVFDQVQSEEKSVPSLATVDKILDLYQNSFDWKYGGFGQAFKFPASLTLELLLREAQVGARHAVPLLNMVTLTLDNMAGGEIYDKEAGGFFRYATERDWSFPHYEKMLDENAGIILNYLHAFELTKKPLYRQVAENCLNFVDRLLANHPLGGFFGSQDADEKEIDKTIYTDSSCHMVSAYLEAYRILGDKKYLAFAIESMRFLLTNNVTSFGAAHYYSGNEDTGPVGLLADQVWSLMALIDLFDHDPQPDYLTQANDIADVIVNRLAANGSFYDKPAEADDIGNMTIRYRPVKENALLALALQRLSVQTNSKDFADMARGILSSFSFGQFKDDYISMAPYALALSEILGEELKKAA